MYQPEHLQKCRQQARICFSASWQIKSSAVPETHLLLSLHERHTVCLSCRPARQYITAGGSLTRRSKAQCSSSRICRGDILTYRCSMAIRSIVLFTMCIHSASDGKAADLPLLSLPQAHTPLFPPQPGHACWHRNSAGHSLRKDTCLLGILAYLPIADQTSQQASDQHLPAAAAGDRNRLCMDKQPPESMHQTALR